MDRKIFLQELAEAIAIRENMPKKKAETFCRIFFEVVEEGLKNDKYVKIKGFGTFKLIPVGERESVNVNTGERIQISGHSKISFTPDPLLRDLVNKPFSHFQTVVLNEETDVEELESVPTPVIPGAEEEEEDTPEMRKTEAEDICEEAPVSKPEPEAEAVDMSEIQMEEKLPDSSDEETAANTCEESSLSDTEANEPAKEEAAILPPITETPEAEKSTEGENPDVQFTVAETTEEEEECVAIEEKGKGWKRILLVLLVATLMALSYFAGYNRILCPDEADKTEQSEATESKPEAAPKATPQPESPITAPEDSTGTKAEEQPIPSPITPIPQQAKEEKAQINTPAGAAEERTHVMKAGEGLFLIARRYYGNKKYAQQIIEANNFENPDIIDVGTVIILPPIPEAVPQ